MKTFWLSTLALILAGNSCQATNKEKIEFKNDLAGKKVEVFIGGQFFTAFIYPDNMEKQILYPIATASGQIITRGYPLNPRPFERSDHPHHVGLWFNFGSVNGLDFWNNSFAITPDRKLRYGSIKFCEIVSENPSEGTLITSSDWVDVNNKVLLSEETTFIFEGKGNLRSIERISRLTARQQVSFVENKEGMIGLRLDRAFEEPVKQPGKFLDANGNVTEVPLMNNEGVNGVYRNADGIIGSNVWGKRSPWVANRAVKEGKVITIAILDHKNNPNYPAWSHARGYGLFATNNLGGRAFDKNVQAVKLELNEGESIVFKHKIVIGGDLTDAEINEMSKKFE